MVRGTVAVLCVLLATAACSPQERSDPTAPLVDVHFVGVRDATETGYYSIGPTARGVTSQVGSYLTIDIDVTNANSTVIDPKAEITYANGTTDTCQETDLRRLPSHVRTTTDWDLPCGRPFPTDVTGATVVVTDDFK